MSSISLCTPSTSSQQQDAGEHYRLLELPDDIAKLIEAAQEHRRSDEPKGVKRRRRNEDEEDERECLIINGRHNDEAVLSTTDRTYALREVTQSNSLLLCAVEERKARSQLTMKVNVSSVLELSHIVPRLDRISTLLKASAYEGEDEEKRKIGMRKYTPREVRSIVQASDAELQVGYDERCAVCLDGYMRTVSPAYLNALLKSLILIMDANSFLPDHVPLTETVQALQDDHDVREEVATSILRSWFGSVEDSTAKLDMNKIARYIGEQLLRTRALQPTKTSEFIHEWHNQLSGGGISSELKPDLNLLRGLYIQFPAPPTPASSNVPRTIQYYPKSLLPLEPAPRFQELFLTRSQWFLHELEPFIEDLSVDSKRREALLLRYARAKKVKVDKEEVTVYSARVRY